jgi:hypothetical protein
VTDAVVVAIASVLGSRNADALGRGAGVGGDASGGSGVDQGATSAGAGVALGCGRSGTRLGHGEATSDADTSSTVDSVESTPTGSVGRRGIDPCEPIR